ncbi:MAG: carboxypeptidase-like regulatory domain-containing protein [bacterium]
MARRCGVVSFFACTLIAAGSAFAQRVHGTVRDSVSGIPIAGAVVWITDSAGGSLARSIGDETGRYSIGRFRGSLRVHVVHIGFHPRDVLLAADSSDSPTDIRLEALPPNLATVSASTSRVCPGQKGSSQGLELWEQARAALLASVVAREAHPPHVRLVSFARTREPIRKRLTHEEMKMKDLVVDRSYVAGRPAWAFAAEGYMREDRGGERTYFAPDDETLLDPSFAETHCLHVQRADRAHENQVGIAFEPVEGADRDTIVDVRGVLWLDRAHPALRSLEFHFTGLEPVARESGGEVFFHLMPNGAPMIERWNIHTAIVATDAPDRPNTFRRAPLPREQRTDARRVGLREVGGEVAVAEWPDGSSWRGGLPRITGVLVRDDGSPVAGARVWMLNTSDTVTSDTSGRFALPYTLPGMYYVLATDSVLADFGVSRTAWTGVALARNADANLRIRYHPRADALQLVCEGQPYKAGSGVVLLRVVDHEGTAVGDARVEVWLQSSPADTAARNPDRVGETGDDGGAIICGAKANETLHVRASNGHERADVTIEGVTQEVTFQRLVLRPPAP